ncbi:Ig-like domain-containing protein [Maribacter sp. HTCC2170]|uniref:Ig-like domain-containing protein n=1 Tax=Maribacter sp. (strain HTCC2170 / KCCM 42371) TaxID=313603 RepID=UPI00006B1AD9|nr:Ig-like domain-containing protein [Maribacter sp. HTCC2170]EAR00884.1 hypothetical protein FB2170_17406 [Maribacter sp. HTCC2170]
MRLKITFLFFVQILLLHQIGAQCTGVDFEERNGIAILEAEAKTAGSWNNESKSGASAGRTLAFRGSNSFSAPGSSVITYSLRINSPGTYRFIWRNKIGVIASHNPSTEHNDSWLKINASNFYGQRGSHRIYPGGSGKSPVPNGASSGGYFKIYTNKIDWSWDTWTSDHDAHSVYATFNSAGTYTIKLSGRSNGHYVDRMVLYKESSYSLAQAQSLSLSQTNCSGGSNPPPPPPPPPANNIAPTVNFSNLTEGQSFNAGSTISVGVNSNDSDGSISKHQIFVNGSLVDTDGTNYSTYSIVNASTGNYAIKAVVTDNSGATAEKTVNIVVGSGSTTPPPPPPPPSGSGPSVDFSNLTEGQSFASGSTISIGVDASGSIVKYQIFVNSQLVDTDGSSYTPHRIVSASSGNYAVKVIVTDNSGATATKTVNVVVGGSTTPPPPPPPSGNSAPIVSFSNLTDGQNVAVGSTVSVGISASDSDGNIVKYQVFVNGSLKDTDGSNYTAHPIRNIVEGSHIIRVDVTDNDGAVGTASITIVAGSSTTPPPTNSPISFNLVNSVSNGDIMSIVNGSVINRITELNIRASTSLNAKSVKLTLSGASNASRTENVSPYALFGDVNGNYLNGSLNSGSYTLKAEAYAEANGTGSKLGSVTISFTVNDASSGKSGVIAFPNPILSDGKVSLRLPEYVKGKVTYSVISTSGVLIEKGGFNVESENKSVGLNLSKVGNQESGVYYLTIQSSQGYQTIPLIRSE